MIKKCLMLGILFSQTVLAVPKIPSAGFTREIAESNYFSDGPATFATLCVGDECQSAELGHTRIDRKQSVDGHSLFTIGSNSKYVTAVLIMILVDQNYLKLEDKLADFFPEYSQWQGVTVRDLLNHSSGVPPYIFSKKGINRVFKSVFNWHSRKWKPYELVNSVIDQPSVFPAGSQVEYNNTNYVLLGMIAEKVMHTPFASLLDQYIFKPLDMKDTYLAMSETVKQRRVSGYLVADFPMPSLLLNLLSTKVEKIGPYLETTHLFDSSFVWTAGGMVSTSGDLAKLTRALFHGKLISPALLEEMKKVRPGRVFGTLPINYGLGMMRMPSSFGDGYGHGGLSPGYQVLTNYFQDYDMVLVVGRNMGPSQLYAVYFDLLDRLFAPEKQKPFIEDPTVNYKLLNGNGVHLRLKGRLTTGQEFSPFSVKTMGYAEVRKRASRTQPFSNFQAYAVTRNERPLIILHAEGGKSLFDPTSKPNESFPFMEIIVDRSKVLATDSSVFVSRGDGMVLAYKGFFHVNPDKVKENCVAELLDEDREAAFQIEHNYEESFKVDQSIKFAGNIPMKKVDLHTFPQTMRDLGLKPCP